MSNLISRRECLESLGKGAVALALAGRPGAAFAASDSVSTAILPGLSESPSLKARAAQKGILFGSEAMKTYFDADPNLAAAFKKECAVIVPGNELKWGYLRPNASTYSFAPADWLMDFAENNGMPVRGHTLVWGDAMPAWTTSGITSGNALTMMTDHINTVVGRYAGRIYSWDVVNEPIVVWDGRGDGLGVNKWLSTIGPSYVKTAFDLAHAADPTAKLVLNQNYLEYETGAFVGFRAKTLALLENLLNSGTPVHGLGIQAHMRSDNGAFNKSLFRQFLADVAALGLEILITELDVYDANLPADVPTRDHMVAAQYRDLLEVALDEPAVSTVTVWGLTDKYHWYIYYGTRPDSLPVRPAPLDGNLKRKLAWHTLGDAFDKATVRPG